MTTQVNIQDAKTHLPRLLTRAAAGEDVVIARGGVPIVHLVAVQAPAERELGSVELDIPDRFWEPLPEDELARWE
ncbi:MAG: type II toxin-antitoxin system Phd/YefM family antitoxin [Actinomycetota bacterium]|nr:type II toxin-antitoxin system Phd/YefM family antitoxin [Actinomycetota bacterium]